MPLRGDKHCVLAMEAEARAAADALYEEHGEAALFNPASAK